MIKEKERGEDDSDDGLMIAGPIQIELTPLKLS